MSNDPHGTSGSGSAAPVGLHRPAMDHPVTLPHLCYALALMAFIWAILERMERK